MSKFTRTDDGVMIFHDGGGGQGECLSLWEWPRWGRRWMTLRVGWVGDGELLVFSVGAGIAMFLVLALLVVPQLASLLAFFASRQSFFHHRI